MTVTVDTTATNGDGSYTVTNATGTYQVGATSYNITGLGQSAGEGADNHFWPAGNSPAGSYFDSTAGLSVATSDPNADANAAGTGESGTSPNVDIYASGGKIYEDLDHTTGAGTANNNTAATSVTVTLTCYVTGSLIRTAHGDVAVENLRVGDLVETVSGELRPIKWIGSRAIDARSYPNPHEVMPARIAKDAFGPGKPERDLLVSPSHAVCVTVIDEVFVHAGALVNDATVTRVDPRVMPEVTYWHVELDSHDMLIANGLPSESFLDMGNRDFFLTGEGSVDPSADPQTDAAFCRPFIDSRAIPVVRERMRVQARRLGWTVDPEPAIDLRVVADGEIYAPDVDGHNLRFILPANVKDLRLVSSTSVPNRVGDWGDDRALGVAIGALSIDDGLRVKREIGVDDVRLAEGFHEVERNEHRMWRWTNGAARLSSELWDGCQGQFFLRVDLVGAPMARWIAPAKEAMETVTIVPPRQAMLRLVVGA
jgi:hypothetical protein